MAQTIEDLSLAAGEAGLRMIIMTEVKTVKRLEFRQVDPPEMWTI